jgi:hypothetical protein
MEAHLSGRHRDTVEKIFSQPPNRNIEWREVIALLEAVGTVTHEHNGKLKVSLGPETEVFPGRRGPDRGGSTANTEAGRFRARRLRGRRRSGRARSR